MLMKILYIHQFFLTPAEPGGTRSYWFAKELIANGHEVTMLTSCSAQNEFLVRKKIEDIDVIYIKNPYDNKMGIAARLWSFIKFMFSSSWIGLQQKNIDLVYATSTPLSIGIPALIIKYLKGTNYIFEVRDLWPEVPIQMRAIRNKLVIKILRWFERTIYKHSLHIVALSPGMQSGVIESGTNPSKVSMIPNMAKKNEFFVRAKSLSIAEYYGINLNHFNAVHFGAMGKANGLEYVIDAAIILKENGVNNINIIFLGEGKIESKLRELCQIHRLTNVKFLGKHPMKEVSEIVNICDASIVSFANIPILYTNSPNKLFDSLSAGKPLIVNSAGWTKQMVEENKCGIYVDPTNPAELANGLIKMKEDNEWVEIMSLNSRRLAEETYDKSILCKQFVSVVEKYNVQEPAEAIS